MCVSAIGTAAVRSKSDPDGQVGVEAAAAVGSLWLALDFGRGLGWMVLGAALPASRRHTVAQRSNLAAYRLIDPGSESADRLWCDRRYGGPDGR
jgi:hypothetical protein